MADPSAAGVIAKLGSNGRNGSGADGTQAGAISALRRLTGRRPAEEQCDLCSSPLNPHPRHEHLLEPATRQLHCACQACALLFPAEARKRYLRVPKRLWLLQDFVLDDAQWEALAIPVNMAFLHTRAGSDVPQAYYPSPAGATESLLTLDGWQELVTCNSVLGRMEPDVEALLINRVGESREHYLAPIDRCYELVGLIRVSWHGLSGGHEAWQRIAEFFSELRSQAKPRGASLDA